MNERKKPAIRFKGFSDEWEQHPMNELTTELHEYTTLDSSYPLLTSSREGIMFQNQYRSNRTTENGETLFSIVPYGKCTYRHMSDDDIFHFNINDIVENGLVSREYPVFDSTNGNDLRFIVALLNSSKQFRKFCREQKIGGTRTRLYYKDLSDFKPLCPEFNEQQSIAEFLDGITSIISQHQSKLEKLQAIKASMLEKMFPKDGADVPEVRFKGFTGAWERAKLENYLSVSNEKNTGDTYDKTDVLSVSGDYGIINQIEFQGRSFAGVSVSNYGVVHTGDVVYTKSPLNSNPYGIIKTNKGKPGIVSTLYAVYHTKKNAFPDFVQVYFEQHARMNNYMHPLVNKGAKNDMKVSAENALKGTVIFPNYREQEAISAFFAKFDHFIVLQQQELDKLQSIKKALLEKMIV